jgi:hypothetical protein
MKAINRTVLVLFLFLIQNVFADAMAKGYQLYKFDSTIKADSLFVFESDNLKDLEVLDYSSDKRPWVTYCEDNSCRAKASTYQEYQKIVVFVNGKPIVSEVYKPKGSNPIFKATLDNGIIKVKETTSFLFKGTVGEILRALIITLILEILVGFLFFGFFKDKKALKTILILNCFTLPLVWLVFPFVLKIEGFSIVFTIIVLEILVLILEFFGLNVILKDYSKRKLFVFALVANLVSFLIGGLLYIITLFI